MTNILNDENKYYDIYQKYKIKYLSLKNIQTGGFTKLVVHISGPSGSGKTTLGNKLKNTFGNKIVVKDIDDLRQEFITKYYYNRKWSTINKNAYQKYIDDYVSKQKKHLIFVGLNNMPWWHKNHYYNMHSDYNYCIELDNKTIVKQKCKRFLIQIAENDMDYMINNNNKFIKNVSNAIAEECDLNKIIKMNNKWNIDYKKQNYKFLSSDNIFEKVKKIINKNQSGGVKNVLIHVTGPQGSGKTTIGNKLKEMYKNKIYMKDLDDLNSDFHHQDSIKDYQKFMDNFIFSHKDKPLILVGLDADLCLGPTINPHLEGYQIQTPHKYHINIDMETNLKQWFFRQIDKLCDRKEWFYKNWLQDNKNIQDKLFRYVDINEMKKNKVECDTLYKKKGYQFMNYDDIMQKCKDILKLD